MSRMRLSNSDGERLVFQPHVFPNRRDIATESRREMEPERPRRAEEGRSTPALNVG